jgi:hypothetical protein
MKIKVFIRLKALLVATVAVCAGLFVLISCEDNEKSKSNEYDPTLPVELTSFMPDSGRISEMILLSGSNFGTNVSNIKVFFNAKEAKVLGSTGSRILALVPRLPGDTCILKVEIGDKSVSYPDFFRYKVEASVTTLAGDGTNALTMGSLDKSQLRPVYIGTDNDYNIFVTEENNGGSLLKLNEQENSIVTLATADHGMSPRFQPNAHPVTNVIMFGSEGGGNRDRFITLDPREGWSPKMRFIRNWDANGFTLPTNNGGGSTDNHETHYHCLYCKADGNLYTRYSGGQIVQINPKTWDAKVVYETNSGIAYGMAFHPVRTSELWIGYSHGQGDLGNSLCTVDVIAPAGTFKKLSGATNGGHRDGRLDQAQFYNIRQMNFDAEGNLYIGDASNHCIRKVDTDNMIVETIIGIPGSAGFKDGSRDDAQFRSPHGIATDPDGIIYVSDYDNNRVRRIAIE